MTGDRTLGQTHSDGLRWSNDAGITRRSAPTVVDGVVYVGAQLGHIKSIDATDGTDQWSFDTETEVRSAPCVAGGTVFACGRRGILFAIDAASGVEQWRFQTEGGIYGAATVVDGTVYVGDLNGAVYAINAATGDEAWVYTTDARFEHAITVANGRVFAGDGPDTSLHVVDAQSGERVRVLETARAINTAPTVADGTAFVADVDNSLYAFDIATGETEWRYELHPNLTFHRAPTVADGTVYCGTLELHAIDVETGEMQWTFEPRGHVRSSPTVADGTVFFGSDSGSQVDIESGKLYGLDTASGEKKIDYAPGDEIRSSPTIVDGVCYFGCDDWSVYAYDTGVDGSSEDSRVMFGTFGHHGDWRYAGQSFDAGTGGSNDDDNTEEYVRETSESLKDRLSNGTVEEVMVLDGTSYYVVRQIPGEQENIPAYTTTEHELLDPDRALDVAISHEYYRRYNLDAEQRLEYLTDQRQRFENVENLARIADLSGELAGAIALASIEPRAAISNTVSAVTTVVDWANQSISDPYYEQYAKMATTCSTIDWANEHVPEPSGSLLHTTEEALEIVELTAEAAEIAETAGTAVQNIGTVVDIFSAADSVTTSVPADTISGVEDLKTGGYAALVSLASELTVGRLVDFAEAKAKVGTLGAGSFAARRPFCYEWLELEKQLRERELGPSGIIRLMAIRQTDYQIESATFHGISAIEDELGDGILGGINDVIFNSDVRAEAAADIATTYEQMSFIPVLATGEAFNEGTIQLENSINAAEYGDQAVIDSG